MNKETKHSTSQTNPFIIPNDYFTKLEDSILEKVIGDNSQELLPFTTSADYFTHLEENILNQTVYTNKQQRGKIISLISKKWYTIAACLLIAVTLGFYILNSNKSETNVIAHQNKNLVDTIKDKLYPIGNNIEKDTDSFSNSVADKDQKTNTYVSNDAKTKVSEKENNKTNASISNKEKRSSEIIYGLYFEDDFTDLEEGYLF